MKQLNFGIIGFGYFGKYHARVLQRIEGVNLKLVVSNSFPEDSDAILPSSVLRSKNSQDLFSDPEIDCVIIATPPSTHLPLIVAAAAAGKNIFVEKPVVTGIEELAELREILDSSPQCFMVGHIYFYNDYLRYIKKTIEEGKIGAVRLVRFRQLGRGPIRKDATPLEDMAVHHLSMMEYLFGVSEVIKVNGMSSSMLPGKREDFAFANLTYGNGIAASIDVGWFAPKKEKQIMIVGGQGSIVFDDVQKNLTLYKLPYPVSDTVSETGSIWLDAIPEEVLDLTELAAAKDPQQNELEHFVSCVREGKQPSTDLAHAIRMVEMADMVSKSIFRA
jgi:predicted dehydrogenase